MKLSLSLHNDQDGLSSRTPLPSLCRLCIERTLAWAVLELKAMKIVIVAAFIYLFGAERGIKLNSSVVWNVEESHMIPMCCHLVQPYGSIGKQFHAYNSHKKIVHKRCQYNTWQRLITIQINHTSPHLNYRLVPKPTITDITYYTL